jgi:hypothetical protein
MIPPGEAARPLPVHRAFVVQFGAQTNGETGRFAGRIEHVVSGHARHFQTLEELVGCLVQMLATLGILPPEGQEEVGDGPEAPQA